MKKLLVATLGVALSMSVLADGIVIATGSEGGGYERTGKQIASAIVAQGKKKKMGTLDVTVENTTGSKENIEMFNEGEAHIFLAQADALNVYPPAKGYKTKPAGREAVYWFANKKHGFFNFADIEGSEHALMVIVDGSGANVTLDNFIKEDGGYQKNKDKAVLVDDLEEGLDLVASGTHKGKKVAGLLHVTSIGGFSAELAKDFSKYIVIGNVDDGDFNDATIGDTGEPLYTNCEIENNGLRGFKSANRFTDNSTVCMDALVVYSKEAFRDEKKLYKVVRKGITKALR